MTISSIVSAASQHGLVLRGSFAVHADDQVPPIDKHNQAGYLALFGNVGSSMWKAFSRSPEYREQLPHPLNRWSERIGRQMATEFSARALFPFTGPPHWPFLRWAKKAEKLQNSKLGMLIHPQFGLWHAYRFALVLPIAVADSATDPKANISVPLPHSDICGACKLQPCCGACPVQAFSTNASGTVYDVQVCFNYLSSHPDSDCMTQGCQARIACPQGAGYRYAPSHAGFHMRAFVRSIARQKKPSKNMTK